MYKFIFGGFFMSEKNKFFKSVAFGFCCCMLTAVILMCLFAIIIMKSGLLSSELTDYVMLGLLSLACLFGGFISAKLNKNNGLVCGAATAFIVFAVTTIAGLSQSNETVTLLTLLRFVFTLLCGSAGGILGVNQKEKISIK